MAILVLCQYRRIIGHIGSKSHNNADVCNGGHTRCNKALRQCLERSSFDYENDRLIQLGDIVDEYPEVYEFVEELYIPEQADQ